MGGVILVLMGLVFFFAAFYEKSGHQTGKFRKYDGIITEADKKQKNSLWNILSAEIPIPEYSLWISTPRKNQRQELRSL